MENQIKIKADLNIYPLEAIYGASYVFIDRVYIFLESKGENEVVVNFEAKEGTSDKDLNKIKGEFQNELLNYAFRVSLEKRNKLIRQRIIERALYSSIGEEDEIWNDDDPLGLIDEFKDEK